MGKRMKVIIVAPHASARFGGESIIPLHYFMRLPKFNVRSFLVVHERTRTELENLLGDEIENVFFVPDTKTHKFIHKLRTALPGRLGFFTFGFLLNLLTQMAQKKVVKALISEHHIDLVHEPIRVSPKLPSVMYGLGVPVVIGPMNGGMNYPSSFAYREKFWERYLMPIGRCTSVVVNLLIPGKRHANMLLVANERTRKALPVNSGRRVVELVENGVDLKVFGRGSDRTAARDEPIKFIFIGRLVDWKGVDLLLSAASTLPKEKFKLDIVGDGLERERLCAQCEKLNLNDNVSFRGFLSQAECAALLEACDCLVLPSLYECGGAVVLEAMASGLPVIAARWGGPADYIDDSCGILVEVDRGKEQFVADLTNAMLRLIKSPDLREHMGMAGRDKVMRCYDWDKKVQYMIDLYNSVLKAQT
jgi:glycosyltransferase involved in cell wall biosynthesis